MPYRWGTAISSARSAVVGRLAFPTPSSTLGRRRPGPRGFSGLLARDRPRGAANAARSGQSGSPLVIFLLSFRALVSRLEPLATSKEVMSSFLSWDSPALFPSVVRPSARPLPEAEASFGPTVPTARSCSVLVVSHHLDGFLRAEATGLLHPAADCEVRRVSCFQPPGVSEDVLEDLGIPRAAGRTLRRVPLASSRTASLRPLPSCHCCLLHPLEPL